MEINIINSDSNYKTKVQFLEKVYKHTDKHNNIDFSYVYIVRSKKKGILTFWHNKYVSPIQDNRKYKMIAQNKYYSILNGYEE